MSWDLRIGGTGSLSFSLLSFWFADAISATNPRVIDDSRARKLSNDLKRCTYYETCATYGLNVERVFQDGNCSPSGCQAGGGSSVVSQRSLCCPWSRKAAPKQLDGAAVPHGNSVRALMLRLGEESATK